jgi:hypothetical protein
MSKKITDSDTIEKLAVIATSKTSPEENIAEVTRKVIADYFGAKEAIKQYNNILKSQKAAAKLAHSKKQEQKGKTKDKHQDKPKKSAVGE